MTLELQRYAGLFLALVPILKNSLWLLIVAVAAGTAIFLTSMLVKIAPAMRWVVIPASNRWSQRVVAQFGGIPILIATSVAALLIPTPLSIVRLLVLTLGMGALGFVDDIVGLGPKPKLLVQIFLAVLAVRGGIVHPLSSSILLNAAFTVFWIVAITNAFNLIDNIDGLAAGTAVIALAQIVLLASWRSPVGAMALCLMASSAGFLVFNFNPAKIFMGDAGSLPIGFFLACGSIMTASHLSSLAAVLLVPCLVLFIPIFDMLLVSITRRLNGRAISRGARDHSSHRLVLLGLTERQAVWILYGVAFIAGGLALCWEKFWPQWGVGFLSLFLVGASLFWLYLAKLELPEHWLSESNVLIIRVPAFFLKVAAKLSAVLLDVIIVILAFYFACLINLQKLGSLFLVEFWMVAVAITLIQLTSLIISGVYRGPWSLMAIKDSWPIFRAAFLAACFMVIGWLVLPSRHSVPISIILSDAAITAGLLLLTRTSTRLFDFVLEKLRASSRQGEVSRQKQESVETFENFSHAGSKEAMPDKRIM